MAAFIGLLAQPAVRQRRRDRRTSDETLGIAFEGGVEHSGTLRVHAGPVRWWPEAVVRVRPGLRSARLYRGMGEPKKGRRAPDAF